MESLVLRTASVADAQAIAHIRVDAWRAAYTQFMPAAYLESLDPSLTVQGLQDQLSSGGSRCAITVAEHTGRVVGFSMLGLPRYETGGNSIELWALNVQPSSWRVGVGQALTLHAIENARSQGKSAIELWCISGNEPAQRAYQRCGFHLAGQERTTSDLTGHPLHERLYVHAL